MKNEKSSNERNSVTTIETMAVRGKVGHPRRINIEGQPIASKEK
jgi:hypothetical protein